MKIERLFLLGRVFRTRLTVDSTTTAARDTRTTLLCLKRREETTRSEGFAPVLRQQLTDCLISCMCVDDERTTEQQEKK